MHDVSFDLAAGEFLTIVGPNGAGKSTLMKVALGLIAPLKGHAALFGEDAGRHPERIGYVPQLKTFDRTFPATVLELVVSGLRRSWPARVRPDERDAARHTLADVGAEKLANRTLAKLSGGELQRAFLARALVRRPALVLLDEPATGVDFLGRARSLRFARDVSSQKWRDHRDDHSRPYGGALSLVLRGGAQPAFTRFRPARRSALRKLFATGVRPPRAQPRDRGLNGRTVDDLSAALYAAGAFSRSTRRPDEFGAGCVCRTARPVVFRRRARARGFWRRRPRTARRG